MNNYKRRQFIRISTGLLGGFALGTMACNNSADTKKTLEDSTDNKKSGESSDAGVTALTSFGLQLYTLRDDLPKDPKGVLKQVADMGYKQIEGYEGPKGLWWGMKNKEFKSYLDSLGLVMISSHCEFKKDFERRAAEAGEIGRASCR